MTAEPSAMSMKSGDNWAVPLCYKCHEDLHRDGNEREWFDKKGLTFDRVMDYARELWRTKGKPWET